MSDASFDLARRSRRSIPVDVLVLISAVLVLVALTAAYVRIGSWRMESACSLSSAQRSAHNSVAYDWSWKPLGFQCTYDDGTTNTSLWP